MYIEDFIIIAMIVFTIIFISQLDNDDYDDY